ncbi:MAG: AAA family ATPase [Myxococcota bacterium]
MVDSSIVGRQLELERLTGALEGAAEGAGSLWFLTGEAGIGKSRLAEEVARLARDDGMRTLWGRCWEAGGAPAYWPWVQILRAILRTTAPGRLDPLFPALAQMLPELRETHGVPEVQEIAAEQARFQLMDAVGHVLSDVASDCPTVLFLEDLHVADVSTVLLLDFLAATVKNQPILIVATFREAELAKSPSGARLLRTAQQGQRLPLERLSEHDVAEYLARDGKDSNAELAEALHRMTEGHPLFLVEVGRLWRKQGARGRDGRPSIPSTVRHAIHERLGALSADCSVALRRGAIVGREFDISLLEASHPEDTLDYVAACQDATNQTILSEVVPQRYRFAHFLIRELVYDSIPEVERRDAHRRLAETLQHRAEATDAEGWSEVAHHFAAAGPSSAAQAAEAYRRASRQALTQLAFDEAVDAAGEALVAIERADPIDETRRIEILIELAHAQTRSSEIAKGKATAERAAAAAKAVADAELFARAALEHGNALIFARVDADLVHLLEESLRMLGTEDHSIRARVMARLAAALQPSMNPAPAVALARDAIDMARRLEDKSALLDTLRNGGSAMVDLVDPAERLPLDREHAALADDLGSASEALRANVRSFMDFAQLGRLDDALRTLHACERAAESLKHPTYRWRCWALHGLRHLWEGNLDEAEAHIEQVRALGEASGDPNAQSAYEYQRMRLLQLRGDRQGHLAFVDVVERWWRGSAFGDATADLAAGGEHLIAGETQLALDRFDPAAIRSLLQTADTSLALSMARLCAAAEDQELAEHLLRGLSLSKEYLITSGMVGATIDGPACWALAILNRAIGRDDDARDDYEYALLRARRTGGRPVAAWIACEYGEMLVGEGKPEDRHRAHELATSAKEMSEALQLRWLTDRADALLRDLADADARETNAAARSAVEDPRFQIAHVGDSWRLSYGDHEFHLKDMKGVRLLARLVEHPGREFHVLDLESGGRAPAAAVDRGDAGELLDEEARRQYQERATMLREELEEAESWNDAARSEKAREELTFLEHELRRALGIGGRARRAGASAEKARINVQRRVRDAIRRITANDPKLGKHLDQSIRTGTYCCYDP